MFRYARFLVAAAGLVLVQGQAWSESMAARPQRVLPLQAAAPWALSSQLAPPALSGTLRLSETIPVLPGLAPQVQTVAPVLSAVNPSAPASALVAAPPSAAGTSAASIGPRVWSAVATIRRELAALFAPDPGVGDPFRSGQPEGSVQYGVNPRTLIPSKDPSTLNEDRVRNAVRHARDRAIEVSADGLIQDGNHRRIGAIRERRAVDVVVVSWR